MSDLIKTCPFCGSVQMLDLQFRQARGTRRNHYDAAIYCRQCYCYGPRVRSEDVIGKNGAVDHRNETPTKSYKDIMREAAMGKWNHRRNER